VLDRDLSPEAAARAVAAAVAEAVPAYIGLEAGR
jgi:hypothetical protein